VKFSVPKLGPEDVAAGGVHFSSIASTTADNFAAIVQQTGATPAFTGITAASNIITFPPNIPGNYLVQINVMGATSASALSSNSFTGGASSFSVQSRSAARDAAGSNVSLAGTTTNFATLTLTLTLTAAGGTFVLNPSTITGTGTTDVFIFAFPTAELTIDQKEQIEIDELKSKYSSLESKMDRLTAMLSGSCSPKSEEPVVLTDIEDLGSSIHIPRSLFSKMVKDAPWPPTSSSVKA